MSKDKFYTKNVTVSLQRNKRSMKDIKNEISPNRFIILMNNDMGSRLPGYNL